jgi:hypothetical protein
VTGVDASTKAVAALDMPHSEPRRVDTSAAAQMLQMTTNGVRDRCREDKLDSVKIGPQYAITVESIEKYKVQHPRRKRARD